MKLFQRRIMHQKNFKQILLIQHREFCFLQFLIFNLIQSPQSLIDPALSLFLITIANKSFNIIDCINKYLLKLTALI